MALTAPTGMQQAWPLPDTTGFPLAANPGYLAPKAQIALNLSTAVTSAWPLPGLRFTPPVPMPGAGGGGGGGGTVGYGI